MKITSTIAKTEDGTVQITFTVPKSLVEEESNKALTELAKDALVSGFRKGKAPLDKVKETVNPQKLLEKALGKILPKAFSDAVIEHKLRPAIMPKFEILTQDPTWQVRATTCELIEFDLPDYKKLSKSALADLKKDATKEEKETKVLQALLGNVKAIVPSVLIKDEVDLRLSQLLERIEKLGLTLEGYLGSIGKDEKSLREEYEKQIEESIKMELILNKIAEVEKVVIPKAEIDEAVNAAASVKNGEISPERERIIGSILKRRRVLDALTA